MTSRGWEYDLDPRYVEALLSHTQLEDAIGFAVVGVPLETSPREWLNPGEGRCSRSVCVALCASRPTGHASLFQ